MCSRSILFSQPSPHCYILVQSVTEDVLINLDPYICSSEAVLWPGLVRLGNLSSELNRQPCTLMKHHTSGSGLSLLRWRLFSEGNCLFFPPRVRAETTDSQMRRGHSLFSLYQLCDWWIMDEAIDCLARLCSTDPLWIQFRADQKPHGKCCLFLVRISQESKNPPRQLNHHLFHLGR